MIKPVGSLCNLDCKYCYYKRKDKELNIKNELIDLKTLEKFIKECFETNPSDTCLFVFHGGEPTLAGIDFYKEVIEIQKKYCGNKKFINNIQTNGTTIDESWCKFLKDNQFDIGLSIDGTEDIHDFYRGKDTYQRVKETSKLLSEYGIKSDLLCTVTKDTLKEPLKVYQKLKQLNTGWMQFIPIVIFDDNGDLSSSSCDASEYGKFLCDIFDYWIKNDLDTIGVQLFNETLMMLLGYKSSVCMYAKTCGNALVLEHDGSIYSCDHYVNKEHLLGNINDSSLESIVYCDKQIEFGNTKAKLNEKCLSCPVVKLCKGACKKNRKDDLNVLCGGYYAFFTHSLPYLVKVAKLIKNGYNLTQIKEMMNS